MDVHCSCHFGKQCVLTLFCGLSIATDFGGIRYIACSVAVWEEQTKKVLEYGVHIKSAMCTMESVGTFIQHNFCIL